MCFTTRVQANSVNVLSVQSALVPYVIILQLSQQNWLLSISHSVHKHCISSYNSCVLTIKLFHCWCFAGKVTQCCFTTVSSQQISRLQFYL